MEDVQKEEQLVLESIYAVDFSMSGPREGKVRLHAPQDEDSNDKDNDGADILPFSSLVGMAIAVLSARFIAVSLVDPFPLYYHCRVYCRTAVADRC